MKTVILREKGIIKFVKFSMCFFSKGFVYLEIDSNLSGNMSAVTSLYTVHLKLINYVNFSKK
jgi:hypothetical protein